MGVDRVLRCSFSRLLIVYAHGAHILLVAWVSLVAVEVKLLIQLELINLIIRECLQESAFLVDISAVKFVELIDYDLEERIYFWSIGCTLITGSIAPKQNLKCQL